MVCLLKLIFNVHVTFGTPLHSHRFIQLTHLYPFFPQAQTISKHSVFIHLTTKIHCILFHIASSLNIFLFFHVLPFSTTCTYQVNGHPRMGITYFYSYNRVMTFRQLVSTVLFLETCSSGTDIGERCIVLFF